MEPIVDTSPHWLKKSYVWITQRCKALLQSVGLLQKLDQLAQRNRQAHYVRSLLAIHQLQDMIELDVPWWTYDAIDVIDQFLQQQSQPIRVFEYGSGASTIWLAKRAQQVISIEHDPHWYAQLKNVIPTYPHIVLQLKEPLSNQPDPRFASQKLTNANFQSYVESIQNDDQLYDLIIIDGRSRQACLQHALAHLKPNGLIVFDNSNRQRYQESLNQCGLDIKRYPGKVPGSPLNSETAILQPRR